MNDSTLSEQGTIASLIWGPILVGTFLNILLYGVFIAQVYMYYTTYHRDRLSLRIFIALLVVADTLNTAFQMEQNYDAMVSHFGDVGFIQKATWVFRTEPAMTALIEMLVQIFYAWRIKVLSSSMWATLLVLLFAILQCLAGIATAVAVAFVPDFLHFRVFKPAVIVWLSCTAICDCLITLILVLYLRKHKTGAQVTDGLVDKIVLLTVQTGALTSIIATIDLILFVASPSGLHLAFNIPLSKLYTNALLSSLNARGGWARDSNHTPSTAPRSTADASFGHQIRWRPIYVAEELTTLPEENTNRSSYEVATFDEMNRPRSESVKEAQGEIQLSASGDRKSISFSHTLEP
ncbi:uncharacterized protein STEHIDRAFT_123222 [Stereum hirsutum FP-91666 SS1]|uniref:uncharacterized protein n=1 Tax=Stereum hirsutum (strain FP-91666) TaxID=721885 RepID=UPI000444A2EB|nr:uncharacterized protein STEHIDRAFT_123222 [Stereum hirsutum FP-91666 SS1]EIM84424.1 hypothetical protein STEHIDRAFT_123222 [Stereum hirsutum FP-91666 SS1]